MLGGTNPWTSNFYPEDTVMAYRNPLSGQWPQWFSPSDIRALVETWGLEDDHRGSYQLSIATSGQPLMIGDPVTANSKLRQEMLFWEGFKPCQSEIYGSSDHDELYGLSPAEEVGQMNGSVSEREMILSLEAAVVISLVDLVMTHFEVVMDKM